MVPFIQTPEGVTLFVKGETHEIQSSDKRYTEILDLIKADGVDVEDDINEVLTRDLRRVAIATNNSSDIQLKFGVVYFNGAPVHNSITDRIIRMVDDGFDAAPLVEFLRNIMKNPSFRVVNSLYDFLEYGKIPITSDGHFLAYKAVRKDFKDIHSGTIDNSVGQTVEVPRNQVDEDPNQTCSHGLHVCSFSYLPHFAHAEGHVVICKVNPADVVAIPTDYNNTKMRVSKYVVVGEHADYYTDNRSNLLSQSSVIDDYDDEQEEEFALVGDDSDDYFII